MAAIPREKPSRTDENRAEFARYKADVKARGKPFYPYAMLHDTIMSLIVVLVIIGLAIIWKFTAAESHDGGTSTSGILGKLYTSGCLTTLIHGRNVHALRSDGAGAEHQ